MNQEIKNQQWTNNEPTSQTKLSPESLENKHNKQNTNSIHIFHMGWFNHQPEYQFGILKRFQEIHCRRWQDVKVHLLEASGKVRGSGGKESVVTRKCKSLTKSRFWYRSYLPGDSSRDLFIPKRWRSPATIEKGHLSIPKRSQRIASYRWWFHISLSGRPHTWGFMIQFDSYFFKWVETTT